MKRHVGSLIVVVGSMVLGIGTGMATDPAGHQHVGLDHQPVKLAEWHPKHRELCTFLAHRRGDEDPVRPIDALLAQLRQEPELAEYLLDPARSLGTAVCIDDRADLSCGYFDYHFNIIAISESLSPAHRLIVLAHELRHVGHVAKGYRMSLEYDINEMVRLTYAIEADAQAMTALYGWRLKQRGAADAWFAMLDWQLYADIAVAFGHEMDTSGDEAAAALAAFAQWYRSPWRLLNYRQSCRTGYLDLQDDTKRIPQYAPLPAGYFDGLCVLPDGRNYGCNPDAELGIPPKVRSDESPP